MADEGNQEALGETMGKFRSNGRKSALRQCRRAALWKALVWQEVIQDKYRAAFWGGLADRQDGCEPGIWAGKAIKAVWLCAPLQAVGEELPPCPESGGWYPQPRQGAEGASPTVASGSLTDFFIRTGYLSAWSQLALVQVLSSLVGWAGGRLWALPVRIFVCKQR